MSHLNPLPTSDASLDLDGVFRAHAQTVARWAARLGGPAIDVEDVVQDVFLVARRRLGVFDGQAKVTTWLYRATERIVMAARRKARLRRMLGLAPPVVGRATVAAVPEPGEDMDRAQTSRLVYDLLDRLPARQREALILFQMEELSTDEIADRMGARPATVRVWLHRGRARFAELYDDWLQAEDTRSRGGAP